MAGLLYISLVKCYCWTMKWLCMFVQPVEVCVPYHRTKKREVLVQKFDGQSWSTLPTVLRRGSESNSSHPSGRAARVEYKTSHCKRNGLHLRSSLFLCSKNHNTPAGNLIFWCPCSWPAARCASSPGLWLCPDQSRTPALLHQPELCWCPAPTLELSSSSLQPPRFRPAL